MSEQDQELMHNSKPGCGRESKAGNTTEHSPVRIWVPRAAAGDVVWDEAAAHFAAPRHALNARTWQLWEGLRRGHLEDFDCQRMQCL